MAHTMTGWTQALLARHELFASEDADEVRTRVAQLLNDHVLEPRGSMLAARLNGVQADALGLWMLEYGDAVTVEETRPNGDFVLVQLPLSGSVTVECEEGAWTVAPGSGLIMPSNVPHRLEWEAGACQIILKAPLARLILEYGKLTGRNPSEPLRFHRRIALESSDGEQWSSLMRYFCEQAAHPSSLGWLKARIAEETLMRHLLCAQSISLHEHYLGDEGLQAPKRLQRAQEYMRANLHEDISLDDIARHSGAGVRTLSRMCRTSYGVSPMQLLRDMRLDKVRLDLLNAPVDGGVSEVALRWGFAHLGRFAAAYRSRFGEAPHETLAAAQSRLRADPT
ncbi:AraC family transcriptional regulator [Pusillimonas sp.]|uniref:AraC family transcriptional regulator n=1 Tax=Pusillimonas sp. TaxID=3040095 RepID=UPI0037CC5CC4